MVSSAKKENALAAVLFSAWRGCVGGSSHPGIPTENNLPMKNYAGDSWDIATDFGTASGFEAGIHLTGAQSRQLQQQQQQLQQQQQQQQHQQPPQRAKMVAIY